MNPTNSALALAAAVWCLASCDGPLASPDAPYLVLAGDLDHDAALSGVHTQGAIAWAFVMPGEPLSGVVTRETLEPRLFSYALIVRGPPDPTASSTTAAAPIELQSAEAGFLFGLPLLYETDDLMAAPLQIDPLQLVDWALGRRDTLAGALTGPDGMVVAASREHLLMALVTDEEVALASLPSWASGGAACRIDGLVHGLTLYRSEGAGCGSWRAMAAAGERTEFQGVDMGPLP